MASARRQYVEHVWDSLFAIDHHHKRNTPSSLVAVARSRGPSFSIRSKAVRGRRFGRPLGTRSLLRPRDKEIDLPAPPRAFRKALLSVVRPLLDDHISWKDN